MVQFRNDGADPAWVSRNRSCPARKKHWKKSVRQRKKKQAGR